MQFLANLPFDLNLLPKPVYVVGGAVRDGLLGRVRAELDLDLVISADAVAVARRLATEYRAGFVLLDAERQIARVVFPGMTVDIAQQDGANITDDLNRRDYTLNAIAYNLETQETIDPFNGTQDIQERTIRMVSRLNLADDPLRLLRAYRQGAQLNFTIEPNTQTAIRELVALLTTVAAERVLAELRYLLQTPNSSQWLTAMVSDELLAGWLEIPVAKNFNHRLTQLDRSIELVKQHYPALDRELDRSLRDTISTNRKAIGKLTILLSPDLAVATAQMLRLTFSSIEIQVVTTIINYLPQLLAADMSLTEQYFWFQSVGNNFPLLVLMAIASGVELGKLQDLIDRYLDPHSQVAHPTPLVNGRDLVEYLGIPPSPTIGKLLTEIQLARITCEVSTPDEALQFAQQLKANELLD
ncbi:CCA tRNA nucleotidyltransferase [Chamaesiphon sp. VAR_48_metabat_403]|uniref:CCA tRNA nucleotidyltransferase n=1 Tax=Chamaesiphon sp. VAR_48_metabat_403 TaxID=2964700 RepID=UPI00286E5764|nr:CCA tRNA nucleotidyltransferase [Chamaesiphon sp. VAR_48_metabat_403]